LEDLASDCAIALEEPLSGLHEAGLDVPSCTTGVQLQVLIVQPFRPGGLAEVWFVLARYDIDEIP
jgi:hypothetical protein